MARALVLASILTLGATLSASRAATGAAASHPSPDRAHEAVLAALAQGGDIPGQVKKLIELAWPQGKRDEAVSLAARKELETFGDRSMMGLREAINTVKTGYTDEVLVTALGAQRQARGEFAGTHVPILIDALWVGSHDAKAHAIDALGETHSPFAVQPMIDCALDDPTLQLSVVETLGGMPFPQSRFYLEKVMMEGPATARPVAASSLAQIGGVALAPLRNALKAPSKDARLLAARALLPVATEYELGAIYEYLEKHGDDDAGMTQALKGSAQNIEKAIAARDANSAAGSPRDF